MTQQSELDKKVKPGEAVPDASGFQQNNPDSRGFAPGKKKKEPDGNWHSNHPDANGWHHSSTK